MKNFKSTLLIVGLILVGIISFFIYDLQQENQFLEFEGYEVSNIQEKVDNLYNEEKTDLNDELSEGDFTDINEQIIEAETKEYSERNQEVLELAISDFEIAEAMFALQQDINELFDEDNEALKSNVSEDRLNQLEEALLNFEEKTDFYNRQSTKLIDASSQLEEIKQAQVFIDELFVDGELKEDVSEEEMEEAQTLIDQIKNESLKESLLARIDSVDLASNEEEIEEELEEDSMDEDEEVEEVMEEEVEVTREPEGETTETQVSEPEPTRPSRPSSPDPEPTPTPTPDTEPNETPDPTPDPSPREKEVTTELVGTNVDPYRTIYRRDNERAGQVIVEGRDGVTETIKETTIYPDGTSSTRQYNRIVVDRVDEIIGVPDPNQDSGE